MRFIVDNSVWARMNVPRISERVDALSGDIVSCPPQALEYVRSARDVREFDELERDIYDMDLVHVNDDVLGEIALDIRRSLAHGGMLRAVGEFDVLVAAYAVASDSTVLHDDKDLGLIAHVCEQFRQESVS